MNASPEMFDSSRYQAYVSAGEKRARELHNRGPVRFTKDGKLDPEILETYRRVGLYIFEGLIKPAELETLRGELLDVIDRLPCQNGGKFDRRGAPAVGADFDHPVVGWSKPLGDPLGGTGLLRGRHAVKMFEPEPPKDAPAEVPFAVNGVLQFSDAALRVYGHPDLLGVAASINGDDFVPFDETMIIKTAGLGAYFAWHQDGMTHWNSPDWDPWIHGFNFMVQLFGSTAANGLWFVPGSHLKGKIDLKAVIAENGGNLLPDAVPLISNPGDVAISNRQLVHGSFPNLSGDVRISLNIGFHRRKSVEGACGVGGGGTEDRLYDAETITKRSEIIALGIAARRQRYPDERTFDYRPQSSFGKPFVWNEAARAALRHYHKNDLRI
jgi:hypothetical protein